MEMARTLSSFWEDSKLGLGSAAARVAHGTAKRIMILRLDKSIIGWGCRKRPALRGWKDESLGSVSIYGCTLAVLPEPQIVARWMK